MDGDWGNILYLILMALFVIVGALKKKKKPVENFDNANVEQSEAEMPSGIETIFDSLLGAETFEPQQTHPYQVVEQKVVEEEEILPKYEVKVESKPKVVEHKAPFILEVEDLSDEEEYEAREEEFDWRQAIISKEILDRKYI